MSASGVDVRQIATESAQLDFGHVQPRAVLGCVVDLETVGEALGLRGRERLVERGGGVGIELVHDQDELVRLPVATVHQVPHEMRPVLAPAPVGDCHLAPTAERLEGHEQVGRAVAHVFAVVAFGPPGTVIVCRARRQRGAQLADQLLAALVQADHRPLRVMPAVVDLQHVFHVEHELGRVLGRDAPHPPQVRLERILF